MGRNGLWWVTRLIEGGLRLSAFAAGRGSLVSCQLCLEGPLPAKPAHSKNTEAYDMPTLVHALHQSVMRGLTHVPRHIAEPHLQEISLGIEPDFYFFGHTVSPPFTVSVKYAVVTKASSGKYFTTRHSHFPPYFSCC